MILFLIVFSLCLGSFSSAISYRIVHHLPLVNDRSRCPHCHHVLNSIDLIPLIGFVVRKGKCHYCKQPISYRYPLNEFLHLFTFLILYFYSPQISDCLFMGLFLSTCYTLAWIDYEIQMIPISLLVIQFLLAIILAFPWNLLLIFFQIGSIIIPIGLCYFLFPQQLGLGDLLFVASCALFLPVFSCFLMLLIACFLAILYLFIQIKQKRKKIDDSLPFLPFLTTGLLFVILIL